ncbi:MAG: hypothetical protein MJ165_03810 [Alphaproteobacteria bacterium]|nr:hypothetical protein [Alphaproteobacteria bacterium]
MKKLLGISIVAVLAVAPLMANAASVAVELQGTNGVVAASNDVASTSYVKGAYNVLGTAINSLDTTVNDAENGLVKKVADNTSDISALETTVGDADSGLVKDTAALKTAVGDANSGLVKDVAALETTVGDASNGLVKDVADLKSGTGIAAGSIKLTQLDDGVQASLGNADQAKTDIGTMTSLKTEEKTSLVGAINEVDAHADANATAITNITNGTTTVGAATKATQDGNGKVIAETYATKEELSTAEAAAKDYADKKLVTVHTTWGTDNATATANVITNPTAQQGGQGQS